jgi:hypothetical protein
VSRYKYLGIQCTSSGSFSYAQTDLYQRALKAYFKLYKDFLSHNTDIKTSIHVFDTILPIGCEIWGYFNTLTARFRNESIPLDTVYSKIVHKKSTNFVVFSELGRFPIHYQIIKQMLGY